MRSETETQSEHADDSNGSVPPPSQAAATDSIPPSGDGEPPSRKAADSTDGSETGTRGLRYYLARLARGFAVAYIALIGILAIEELQRRDKVLALISARQNEVAAGLALLGSSQEARVAEQRATLEQQRSKLHALRTRVTSLILVGPLRPEKKAPVDLKLISCQLAELDDPTLSCREADDAVTLADMPLREALRQGAALLFLKRTAERTASGDVFAILVVVAAIGGALIRLYLPGREKTDEMRAMFRAIGGGTVCYLVLSGGSIPFAGTNMTMYTSPAMGSLLGLLAGMFSTRVFKLLSDGVDAWSRKLTPRAELPATTAPAAKPALPMTNGDATVAQERPKALPTTLPPAAG
jgi:hypothetical protein